VQFEIGGPWPERRLFFLPFPFCSNFHRKQVACLISRVHEPNLRLWVTTPALEKFTTLWVALLI
jgi:hypothetical protein